MSAARDRGWPDSELYPDDGTPEGRAVNRTTFKKASPDFLAPILGDQPEEWPNLPPEVLELLAPQAVTMVEGPGGRQALFNTSGVFTPLQTEMLNKIARSRWFLLRNDGPELERLTCGRCKRKHEYFTLACIERPFHGLQELVGLLRKEGQRGQPGAADMLLGKYVRLGTVVPITRRDALRYLKKIDGRNEPLYTTPTGPAPATQIIRRGMAGWDTPVPTRRTR